LESWPPISITVFISGYKDFIAVIIASISLINVAPSRLERFLPPEPVNDMPDIFLNPGSFNRFSISAAMIFTGSP